MTRRIEIVFVLALLAAGAGCSRPAYWADRKRDALDIFTFTVGRGYGVKARAGFVNVGLFNNCDFWGLRGGGFFYDPDDGRWEGPFLTGPIIDLVTPLPLPIGAERIPLWVLFSSVEQFSLPHEDKGYLVIPEATWVSDRRGKSYEAGMLFIPFLSLANKAYYYTQLEVAAGLGYTVRLGFNPGELLDFLLGWTTIDILRDDVGVAPTQDQQRAALPPAQALDEAIQEGNVARVGTLLDAHPELSNGKDRFGLPILSWAGHCGNPEIVKLLLYHGADVSARGRGGQTALFDAAWVGNLAAVEVLVEAGIDVNVKDDQGQTALFGAAEAGHREIAELLCAHGARIDEKGGCGDTALERAMIFHPDMAAAMRADAAKWDAQHRNEARP
jgi:hypothetical protein